MTSMPSVGNPKQTLGYALQKGAVKTYNNYKAAGSEKEMSCASIVSSNDKSPIKEVCVERPKEYKPSENDNNDVDVMVGTPEARGLRKGADAGEGTVKDVEYDRYVERSKDGFYSSAMAFESGYKAVTKDNTKKEKKQTVLDAAKSAAKGVKSSAQGMLKKVLSFFK